jgi:hypothetical protein
MCAAVNTVLISSQRKSKPRTVEHFRERVDPARISGLVFFIRKILLCTDDHASNCI